MRRQRRHRRDELCRLVREHAGDAHRLGIAAPSGRFESNGDAVRLPARPCRSSGTGGACSPRRPRHGRGRALRSSGPGRTRGAGWPGRAVRSGGTLCSVCALWALRASRSRRALRPCLPVSSAGSGGACGSGRSGCACGALCPSSSISSGRTCGAGRSGRAVFALKAYQALRPGRASGSRFPLQALRPL